MPWHGNLAVGIELLSKVGERLVSLKFNNGQSKWLRESEIWIQYTKKKEYSSPTAGLNLPQKEGEHNFDNEKPEIKNAA